MRSSSISCCNTARGYDVLEGVAMQSAKLPLSIVLTNFTMAPHPGRAARLGAAYFFDKSSGDRADVSSDHRAGRRPPAICQTELQSRMSRARPTTQRPVRRPPRSCKVLDALAALAVDLTCDCDSAARHADSVGAEGAGCLCRHRGRRGGAAQHTCRSPSKQAAAPFRQARRESSTIDAK